MTVHVITMVPSPVPKSKLEWHVSPLIQELRHVLMNKGGEPVLPILMGDATIHASQALEPLHGPFDVLITKHKSLDVYHTIVMSDEYKMVAMDHKIFTFGFYNSGFYIEWILPALKKLSLLFQPKVDCSTKKLVESGGKVQAFELLHQANGDSGIENYKDRVNHHPNQPGFKITLSTSDTTNANAKTSESEYNKGWYKAAFSYDIDTILAGSIVSLDNGPKIFGEVSIVKYPTRELFLDLSESDYMLDLCKLQQKAILDRFEEMSLPIY